MKPKQEHIYYIAGLNKDEVKSSPFVERLLSKGYEIVYLVEAIDEYCLSNLPEFEGKKFQNVAKEGLTIAESDNAKAAFEKMKTDFEPLLQWMKETALKDQVAKVVVSERLTESPCALVASTFGWTGNMERLVLSNAHQKANDAQNSYYLNQKKTLEINPRHPIMKELLRRIEAGRTDTNTQSIATLLFRTATLRSGYMLKETADYASSVESLLRDSLGIPEEEVADVDEHIQEEPSDDKPVDDEEIQAEKDDDDVMNAIGEEHEEL